MKTNTHGIKMTGLKEAAKETKCLATASSGCYVQISFDFKTGKVYADFHVGENWTKYHDPNIRTIANFSRPASAQKIADIIYEVHAYEAGSTLY